MNTVNRKRLGLVDRVAIITVVVSATILIPVGMAEAAIVSYDLVIAAYLTIAIGVFAIAIIGMLMKISRQMSIQRQKAIHQQQILEQAESHVRALIAQADKIQNALGKRLLLERALSIKPQTKAHAEVHELIRQVDIQLEAQRVLIRERAEEMLRDKNWSEALALITKLLEYGDTWAKDTLPRVQRQVDVIAARENLTAALTRVNQASILAEADVNELAQAGNTMSALAPDDPLLQAALVVANPLVEAWPHYMTISRAMVYRDWTAAWNAVMLLPDGAFTIKAIRELVDTVAHDRLGELQETLVAAGNDAGRWFFAHEVVGLDIPDSVRQMFGANGRANQQLTPEMREMAKAMYLTLPKRFSRASRYEGWGELVTAAEAALSPRGGNGPARFVQYLRELGLRRPEASPFSVL